MNIPRAGTDGSPGGRRGSARPHGTGTKTSPRRGTSRALRLCSALLVEFG